MTDPFADPPVGEQREDEVVLRGLGMRPLAEHDDAGILEQSENVLDCGLPPGRQEADVCGDLFGYRTAGGPFRAQASGNASSSST